MLQWIKKHKTWTILFIIALLWVLFLGYTSLWQPFMMIEQAKTTATGIVGIVGDAIHFIAQKEILDLIKVLTPLLVPILTWWTKHRMDEDVKRATNKVVRDKLNIGNRRKQQIKIGKDKRKQKK